MDEQRLDRIEDMLSQLITAVGTIMTEQTVIREDIAVMRQDINIIQEDQKAMRVDIDVMRQDVNIIQEDQKAIREDNKIRQQEYVRRFNQVEADNNHTWEKSAQNERDLDILKKRIN